jgi:integrase/recombinase XerD
MPKSVLLGPWVKRFLLEHLISERNLSTNTQRSYRDTLALLLPYAAAQQKTPVDRLEVFALSSDVLRGFLDHIEVVRKCSIRTRSQRLAAVHAMARFIAERSPEHIAWCSEIRTIPFKRFTRNELTYLDKPEMDALLAAPDRRTQQGLRDHALLLFLYNSGARVSEAASLQIGDLNLRANQIGDVQLRGKGRKMRRCPLWPATVNVLLALIRGRSPDQAVFLNRFGHSITRHGIHSMLRDHLRAASASHPSLLRRSISPHTIRHTTAAHLFRSGVDINTIRAWLGHVSIDTTNVYAEVDLQRKAEVLAHSNALRTAPTNNKRWRDDPSLIQSGVPPALPGRQ